MRCRTLLLCLLLTPALHADDWPEWLGPQRAGVWREDGILDRFPKSGPTVRWRAPLARGYSGPAVAAGRVYVMDRRRAAGQDGKPLPATRAGFPGDERVVALDATTGAVVWSHTYDCPYKVSYPHGPRCTPLVRDGRVYTLGTTGHLYCLDATSGKVLWSKNLPKDYGAELPAWGYAAHPLLDGDLLYTLVGGEGSAVVALHKDTGKEVWRALTCQETGYASPVLCEAGGVRQLIIWHAEAVNSLDPATGKVHWTQPYPLRGQPQRPAVSIITPLVHDGRLLVSTVYHGALMLELHKDKPAAKILWNSQRERPRPDGLDALMATPVVRDGHVYGVGAYGDLRCFEAATGKELWQSLEAVGGQQTEFGTVFLVPQGKQFVLFTDSGDLILADLSPKGYKELGRHRLLEPTHEARGRTVVWSHPAFAGRCVFARNDKEIVCVSLAAG